MCAVYSSIASLSLTLSFSSTEQDFHEYHNRVRREERHCTITRENNTLISDSNKINEKERKRKQTKRDEKD